MDYLKEENVLGAFHEYEKVASSFKKYCSILCDEANVDTIYGKNDTISSKSSRLTFD
ncbi:hypothetical protein GCM10007852_25520 [Agaribacter marinus]|uniref:Uncharacterized protein n=1 Tax=Agaribacter marinus TaxID=1431249 RepID=A0AA37WKI8_9ALTE|nr:hypothetical protein GCM10007852_25520 [Agaribacter marinus]